MTLLKKFWRQWKHLAEKIALFQTRVILTFFYFTFMLPPGIIFSLFKDPLQLRTFPKTTWVRKEKQGETLEEMEKQY